MTKVKVLSFSRSPGTCLPDRSIREAVMAYEEKLTFSLIEKGTMKDLLQLIRENLMINEVVKRRDRVASIEERAGEWLVFHWRGILGKEAA